MTTSGERTPAHAEVRRDPTGDISHTIDRTLEQRRAPPGTWLATAEDDLKRGGVRVWHAMKQRPSLGVLVVGGLAVAAADVIGVGELAMGIALGYAAWQVLRKGKAVDEAIEQPRS